MSAVFTRDNLRVIFGCFGGDIVVCDIAAGKIISILSDHTSVVNSLCLSRDGKILVSGSWDKTVKLWDMESFACTATFYGHFGSVRTVKMSADMQYVFCGSDDWQIWIWTVAGENIYKLRGHDGHVYAIDLFPDGKHLASAACDHNIKLWDIETGECIFTLIGHWNWVSALAVSPDGSLIASGSYDTDVRIWNCLTGECVHWLRGHSSHISAIAFFPDGKHVASGSYDKKVRVWDVVAGECLTIVENHSHEVAALAISHDGTRIVSGSLDGSVVVYSPLHVLVSNFSLFQTWVVLETKRVQKIVLTREAVRLIGFYVRLSSLAGKVTSESV